MKVLNNPIVTGVLVVIAVIVVFIQIVPHARIHLFSATAPAVPVVAMAATAPTPVPAPPAAAPAAARAPSNAVPVEAAIRPKTPVDREFVELHFDGWVQWPQRDPFLIITPDPPDLKNKDVDANSPVGSWKLQGIWAQTGSSPLVVINHGIYKVGDEIQGFPGYKILKIEGDEVLVQGPRRKERLGLDRRMPAHP
jgi:hypothetical protein